MRIVPEACLVCSGCASVTSAPVRCDKGFDVLLAIVIRKLRAGGYVSQYFYKYPFALHQSLTVWLAGVVNVARNVVPRATVNGDTAVHLKKVPCIRLLVGFFAGEMLSCVFYVPAG